jgi:hypothetical protein
MKRLLRWFALALRREDGTATVEFVLVFPVVMMGIFLPAMESGLLMTRSVMLDRAVDVVMRGVKLGHYPGMTHDLLKREICAQTVIFPNCVQSMLINMQPISTTTWAMPAEDTPCIDRAQEINIPDRFERGQNNDIIVVQVCMIMDPIFPNVGIGLLLPTPSNGLGGYALVAATAFVNEPT